jgi:hypothetical protein
MQLTINQLLEKFDGLKVDQMTVELGQKRQRLIDYKKQGGAKGGLIRIENSDSIIREIEKAKRS